MTKIINFYGGPGVGKSTLAAFTFAHLKDAGVETELVAEYVKQWAWEEKRPVQLDQFTIFGHQSRREYPLFGKVDVIVTDSPVLLCGYYTELYGSPELRTLFRHMVQTYYRMCAEQGAEHIHVFLKRMVPYSSKGRFQTREEAEAIDIHMQDYLRSLGINFVLVNGDKESVLGFLKGQGFSGIKL
jgi:hypothetical protein